MPHFGAYPFSCFFFTPSFCWLMFGLCLALCSNLDREKSSQPFGGFTPILSWEFYEVLFFVYAAQILRFLRLVICREKGEGSGLSPAFCARLDSQALCLPCRSRKISAPPILTPCRMAQRWENPTSTTHSLTPRLFYRPTLFWPVGNPEKARCDRLCWAL